MNNKTEKIIISLFTILILTTLLSVSSLAYTITKVNGIEVSDVHNKKITFQSWSGFTKETRWAIDYASRQWNNKSGKTILYHSPTQHNNNIFYSRDYQNLITKKSFYDYNQNNDPFALMLTKRYYIKINNKIYIQEADIVINSEQRWKNNGDSDAYDVQNAMTHELGHMLGLDHSTSSKLNTMYPSCSLGETTKRTVKQDDLNGFHHIYG